MRIKPNPGEILRDPVTGRIVPEGGIEVEGNDPHYRWLVANGCAVEVDPEQLKKGAK